MKESWNSAELEEEAYSRGFKCVAGLDEVGRGPWAGPVVAAAVVLPPGVSHPEIKDSKLLTAKKREELAIWIRERAVAWGLGVVESEEIDRMNILKASLLAMSLAFKRLNPLPDYLLIDGPHKIPLEFLRAEEARQQAEDRREATGNRLEPGGDRREEDDLALVSSLTPSASCLSPHASRLTPHALPFQKAIKKGDRLSISIGAASIVAKVARDEIMKKYDSLYPEYGFRQHKGYGSPAHLAALRRYGPAPIHRRSFRPVRECLSLPASQLPSLLAWRREG